MLCAVIDEQLRTSVTRDRILCYAAAAELGVKVDLAPERCETIMAGDAGRPLRVLFWAAYRRMRSRTQWRHERTVAQ